MKLEFEIEDIKDLEYIFALLGYGSLCAISNDVISIENAERVVFAPRVYQSLEKVSCNSELVKLIESGCYLENYERLFPDLLESEIHAQKNTFEVILKDIPKKVDPILQITLINNNDEEFKFFADERDYIEPPLNDDLD